MLRAESKITRELLLANEANASRGPFLCPECNEEVILKSGRVRVNHFAHANPLACKFATGESEEHRRCKMDIYQALLRQPGVSDVALEKRMGIVRPDVSAIINGVKVAIEVQISSLSLEAIAHRTREYGLKDVYVLWLPQWTPYLDGERYRPTAWEKWIHAAYFGRVYYWVKGLEVACYRFDPHFTVVPRTTWYLQNGGKMTGGGYARKSKRFRTALRGQTLDIARDFAARERAQWNGGGFIVPPAKIFMHDM